MKLKRLLLLIIPMIAIGYTLMHADMGSDLLNAVIKNDEGATRRMINVRDMPNTYVRDSLSAAIENNNPEIVNIILLQRSENNRSLTVEDLRAALNKAQAQHADPQIIQALIRQLSMRGVSGMY